MANDNIFIGSGKELFEGTLINISICLTDLPKEWIFDYKEKKYIKLKVQKKREPDQFGKTHSVSIDTYKPEKKTKTNVQKWAENKANFQKPEEEETDLPFN